VLYRDGLAIAALEGGELRRLADTEMEISDEMLRTLMSRKAGARGPKPHFRAPTQREMEMLAKRRTPAFRERALLEQLTTDKHR
jgi:hypothetical protein